jgi:hypothetical protein
MAGVASRASIPLALLYLVTIGAVSICIAIRSYAPYSDEMWGYDLAIRVFRGEAPQNALTFPLFGHHFPYVTGGYQGAFKSYLYLLFLAIGGEGAAEYHRWMNLALSVAVGLAMVWAIRPVAPPWVAALPLLLAVSDPNYVMFSQSDHGPFLFQNLFTALSFGFLLRVALGAGPRHLAAALFFASAVVGDKLTGIPVAVGLGIACLCVSIARRGVLLKPAWMTVYLIVLIVPVLPNIIYLWRAGLYGVTSAMGDIDPLAERIRRVRIELGYALSGSYSYMLSPSFRASMEVGISHYHFAVAALGVMMAACCTFIPEARRTGAATAALLLVISILTALAAFLGVQGLGRPWHCLIFNPLISLTMTAILAWAACYALRSRAVLVRRAAIAAIALLPLNFALAQYNVFSLLSFEASHRGKELASMAIYPLVDKLKELGVKTAVCMDYSLCTSVFVFTAGAIEMVELVYSPDLDKQPLEALMRRPGTVLLLRDISGMQQRSWEEFVHRGTKSFLDSHSPLKRLLRLTPLPRVDDTQYTIVSMP